MNKKSARIARADFFIALYGASIHTGARGILAISTLLAQLLKMHDELLDKLYILVKKSGNIDRGGSIDP